MGYIQFLLPAAPVAAGIAAIVYAAIYLFLKNRREKPGKPQMLAEFVLALWVCMFLYVTQIMAFENGMSGGINLIPFEDFVTAFRYGSNNARMVWQVLLNIVMLMPLGFLLPIVLPRKARGFVSVLLISFGVSLVTEAIQFFTGRGCDIDPEFPMQCMNP